MSGLEIYELGTRILSYGIGGLKPPLVHVEAPQRICFRSPSLLLDQGLGLATKAPTKPDDHIATKTRITSTFSSGNLDAFFTTELLRQGRGLLFLCTRSLTPALQHSRGSKTCRRVTQDSKGLAHQAYNNGSLQEPSTRQLHLAISLTRPNLTLITL